MKYIIALSNTEAEYIALSTALCEVIGIINLLEDLKGNGFNVQTNTPKVTCRTFEDKKSCKEISTNYHTRPRTKHVYVQLHYFCSHVVSKTITIKHIFTKYHTADILTKPLCGDQFRKLASLIMGWA